MKKLIILPAILFAILLISGCNLLERRIPENFDYGKAENGIYKNEFFNLEVRYPQEWVVQSKEQVDALREKGGDIVAGDNESLKRAVKASEVNSAYLLTVFKYEVGAPVEFNPSFMVMAENTKMVPGIKDGKDYLFHAKKLLEQTQLGYTISDDFYHKKIGSKEFYVMEASLSAGGMSVQQEYMVTVLNGFSLAFVASYGNEEQKNELYSIIEKVSL